MGKISEALKKAEREDRSRPLDTGEKGMTPDKAKAAPDQEEPIEPPGRILPADEASPGMDSAAFPDDSPAMADRPVQILPAEGPPMPDNNGTGTPLVRKNDDAVPADPAHPTRAKENANIVVVKTPVPAQDMPPVTSVEDRADDGLKHENRQVVKKASGRELQISYSKTKVQAFDPEELRNNKIFSIFDEIETTNQIKILRTQVLKKLAAIGGNSILVTSANPYEGKTFTSINLGVSIAKEFDRTVLIIDADLRKPTKRHTAFSTDFFSLDVEVGLTDYLKGEADIPDILINPGINKLTLIPSGKPVDNSPELLNSQRMAEMMAEIKSRYASERLVIVDGPAMLPFPDVMILSRYVDGVLPVVEVEKTPVDQLKKMMDSLKDTRVIGTVLNKNRG